MARLGELLLAAGHLTAEQLEQALRAQVMWGGRIGTNLIELGFLDLDALSMALGRQHHHPAALARHFDKVDRELQLLLSPDVAERFSAVPLRRVGPERKIVIASIAPLSTKALAIIADELAVDPTQLIPSIAAELRIRYQLERIYRIPRSARFMRTPGQGLPQVPNFEISIEPDSQVDIPLPSDTSELPVFRAPAPEAEPAAPTRISDADLTIPFVARAPVVDDDAATVPVEVDVEVERAPEPDAEPGPEPGEALDDLSALAVLDEPEESDLAIPVAVDPSPSGRERRSYVRIISDPAPSEVALGRIALRKVSVTATARPAGLTLGEATRAIRRGSDRDLVADLVIDTLFRFAPSCEAALMLVLRGQTAISWKAFIRSGATPPEIAVPLDQPGLVPRAVAVNLTVRAPATDLTPIDQLLLVSLGQQTGDLAVVPVSIGGRVMCAIAMVTAASAPTSSAESIAAAAGAAFARLMRDAAR